MLGDVRRRDGMALLGVLALAGVAVWIVREIRTSDDRAVTATEWAVYIAMATFAVMLLALLIPWWWKRRRAAAAPASPGQLAAAAEQLAQNMHDYWRQEAKERRISTPAPVRVRWRWGAPDVAPPPTEVVTAPVAGTGPHPLPGPRSGPAADQPEPDQPSTGQPSGDQPGELLRDGVVDRLHDEVYCRLPHGRLVLLGGRVRARPAR